MKNSSGYLLLEALIGILLYGIIFLRATEVILAANNLLDEAANATSQRQVTIVPVELPANWTNSFWFPQ